jgi:hypothetical protein
MTMKNVSKWALFVAAGMMSAGAHAASIEIAEDTTFGLEGEFNAFYLSRDTVDSSQDVEDNKDDLAGALEFELSAVRSFDTIDAYVTGLFEFTTLEKGGSSLDSDEAVAGLIGDFGQIEVGHTDSVYEDLIIDALDPFEEATLAESAHGLDEDTMVTYYSPSMNGLSLNVQLGYQDEVEGGLNASEQNFIVTAAYDFGAGSFGFGYDDKGTSSDSSDELIGVLAAFNLGSATEVALTYETETAGGVDRDLAGASASVDYGAGNIYGAFKSLSQSGDNDQQQYGVGIDYSIESDWKLWAEYANFDGQAPTDKDMLVGVGTEYKF